MLRVSVLLVAIAIGWVTVSAVNQRRTVELLKRDSLGWVELVHGNREPLIRRVAAGGRIPGSGWIGRLLLRRERRALEALAGAAAGGLAVPRLVTDPEVAALAGPEGQRLAPRAVLVRSYQAGLALHQATQLPRDFFDLVDALVMAMHRAGVCHNDLHKEQNLVVGEDGRPALIDFQLASIHRRGGRAFRVRCAEDLRHVQKHRRRYTRDGRGPVEAGVQHGAGLGRKRGPLAWAWRRMAKPLYNGLTRKILRTKDGEERRLSSGPWPRWVDPVGDNPLGSE